MGQRKFRTERCKGCGLHLELCLCAEMPSVQSRVHFIVVQNNHEWNKPTNTGRMAHRLLEGSELLRYAVRDQVFDPSPLEREDLDYLLLFPRAVGDAPPPELDHEILQPSSSNKRPKAVVVLDGTWAQCSRMSRRIEAISRMPAYVLPPGADSHWMVRDSGDRSRLCTLEAMIRVVNLADGPGVAHPLQDYFDRITAAMLFMKGKLPKPEVPASWQTPTGKVRD